MTRPAPGRERTKAWLRGTKAWLTRATDLLAQSLDKWEDEEDSVKEEKADHIADLKKFFDEYNAWVNRG